ncbi:MAG TPA: PDZ domain-containing protein [Pirellulales bacterium]|nr:PDZ domain-containing protein [Pirellulales bacterium]
MKVCCPNLKFEIRFGVALICAALCGLMCAAPLRAADDLALREEAAMKAAVDRVAPSVVRIETLGGLETIGNLLVGTGPTSGLIVSSDGYIISSAFNFVQQPAQMLVDLPDGTRLPAKVVAHDHSRMLVLLKVSTDGLDPKKQLPVPLAAPTSEMSVGQWAIAVGRTFDGDQPNMSVGIISALNRVWGRAIQTDAKISPANYGGPLVDLQGRVLGVLVPMSPQETSEVAGVEWYDSGIGFAVPLEQINRVLDRLKKGEDLNPGLLGVSLRPGDPYADPPMIAASHPKSPAAAAGFKAGDRIAEINGVKVNSASELHHQLGPLYAGEKINVVALRGEERIERSAELVAKLPLYIHPFLGILPLREIQPDEHAQESGAADKDKPGVAKATTDKKKDGKDKDDEPIAGKHQDGVVVRQVYADSPAAKVGILPGDRIESVNGETLTDRLQLQELLSALEPLQAVQVEIEREGKKQKLDAKLATLPETVPDKLAPAHDANPPADKNPPATGKIEIKIPEAPSGALAYVPSTYNSHVPHGLVVWLHPAGGYKADELIAKWKPLCEANDLILLAPNSAESARWQRTELEFIRKAIDDVVQKYNIDPARIVVMGEEAGGGMAYLLAGQNRDLIRGVAAINAAMPPGMRPPENDPVQRLAVFTTTTNKPSPALAAGIKRLREAKHPVTELDLGEIARPLTAEELAELVRWIDTLDRS